MLHRPDSPDANGILLVDKPQGLTSHDIVNSIRRKFGFKKVGHAGTLDPMATGLLVMLIGRATKLSDKFLNDTKAYEGTLKLGITTDTADAMGSVVKEVRCDVGPDEVRSVMGRFLGEIEQVPPMFSAKKYKGKKLYQYARQGVDIAREPKRIRIDSLDIISLKLPEVSFVVACSKGTYIRQLAVDIGEALGTGAHLTALRRIRSGDFDIKRAVEFNFIDRMTRETLYEHLIACA